MSIDQVGRRAGADLRTSVLHDLDVDASLAALEGTWRRRRRARIFTAGLTVAAAASVVLALGPRAVPGSEEPAPATQGTPNFCFGRILVSCPTKRSVAVEGFFPYTVRGPAEFTRIGTDRSPEYVDFYQKRADAGVTVISGAVAARRAPGHLDTQDLASWVASRSFLETSPVMVASVDGLPAWRVDVTLRRGELDSRSEWCNGYQPRCRALLRPDMADDPWETGPWRDMRSSYTFVDVPGPRTLVIWSWTFGSDERPLQLNEQLIAHLRFDRTQ